MANKVNKKELDKGAKVEMEHAETIKKYMRKGVSVKTVARSIARDHLSKESPDYYKELSKMEKKLDKKQAKKK
jgi:hypothetical protein